MVTMILISSVAILVGLVGSAVIWGLDVMRADEIEHAATAPVPVRPALEDREEAPRSLGA
jgi:hypothetical protein